MIGEDGGCAIELFRFALDVLDRPRRADADAVATAVASVGEGRFGDRARRAQSVSRTPDEPFHPVAHVVSGVPEGSVDELAEEPPSIGSIGTHSEFSPRSFSTSRVS